MDEFGKLIDAAQHGKADEVRAIVGNHAELIKQRDKSGATALHYAAFAGHRAVVQLLVAAGAEINAPDSQFGATPMGWAVEYLREMGGFLAIELSDFAHAIERGDVEWARRFLNRFPALRRANDTQGRSFELLARQSGNQEIVNLFGSAP